MSVSGAVDWVTFKALREPSLRLVCFPCAGGTPLDYRPWAPVLEAAGIEVQAVRLPGRETRIREPPYRALPALIDVLVEHFDVPSRVETVLFGHSMGALIAFELAHALRARNEALTPAHLVVAARIAPQLQARTSRLYALPDAEFLQRIRSYDGSPARAVEHPALMQLLLPTLRADFELVETYAYVERARLGCPISAFGGKDDPFSPPHYLEGWAALTSAEFSLSYLPGGHFFHRSARSQLLAELVALVTARRSTRVA